MSWLGECIVDHRIKGRTVADIDIAEEQTALNSPEEMEQIQNTPCIVSERIWNRVYDELQNKYHSFKGPQLRPSGLVYLQMGSGTRRCTYSWEQKQ